MTALTVYLLVVLGLQALSILSLVVNHRSIPKLTPQTPVSLPENPPKVSVIVPARNEEENIERCVRSLLGQDYVDFELIVVDDRSDDRSGEILDGIARDDGRLKVLHGVDPAPGWLGKNHAIHQGVCIADGAYFLFVDADTDLDAACLRQVTGFAENHGSDLLTIIPRVINITFWERVVQPAIMQMILAYFPASRINDSKYPKAASGNGPFMLFRRAAYEAIGGHAGVKADIVEDLTLARKLKGAGFRLSYLKGIELQRLRMYTSLGEIWKGWGKNFHTAVGGKLPLAVVGAAALFVMFVLPWILTPVALLSWVSGSGTAWPFLSGAAVLAAAIAWRRMMEARYGSRNGLAWLQPIGFTIVAAILVNSTYRASTGRMVDWKGRSEKLETG